MAIELEFGAVNNDFYRVAAGHKFVNLWFE
jgi:hypothetical protein